MAIALVSNVKFIGNGSGGGTTSSIDTSGSTLIVTGVLFFAVGYPAGFSVTTDNKGNTYTALTSKKDGVGGTVICYCANPTVGSGHTFSVAGSLFEGVYVQAFSGAKTSSPFDVENGANGTGAASLATGSVTPSEDNEVVVSFTCTQNTSSSTTIDNSFTISDKQEVYNAGVNFGGAMAYKVQTTAAAVNPTWTATGAIVNAAVIATFKAATVSSSASRSVSFVIG